MKEELRRERPFWVSLLSTRVAVIFWIGYVSIIY
jgi:hypothetical protein